MDTSLAETTSGGILAVLEVVYFQNRTYVVTEGVQVVPFFLSFSIFLTLSLLMCFLPLCVFLLFHCLLFSTSSSPAPPMSQESLEQYLRRSFADKDADYRLDLSVVRGVFFRL